MILAEFLSMNMSIVVVILKNDVINWNCRKIDLK